jgi:hypothetical protein
MKKVEFSIENQTPYSRMESTLKRVLLIAALAIPTLFFSCEGPEGAIGPKGDAGQVGQQGPKGDKGDKGDKGEAGESAGAFQITLGASTCNEYGSVWDTTALTGKNLLAVEKGLVQAYVKSSGSWFPIPNKIRLISEESNLGDIKEVLFAYRVVEGSLATTVHVFEANEKRYKFQDVRVVIVPASNARLNAELDWTSYEEVRKAFNLAE